MKTGRVLINRNETQLTQIHCRQTETYFERARGLLFSKKLTANDALWISNCNSIHTFLMRYAIDIMFVDDNGKINKLVANLKPWRFAISTNSTHTLELAAGFLQRIDVQAGDYVQWH